MGWPHEIVTAQKVSRAKVVRAKDLRRKMTPEEGILWRALRDRKLGVHFRRQQVIAGYIVDFYEHSKGIVIEVDGPIHAAQGVADVKRDSILAALGLLVLRFTNREVFEDLSKVLELISDATGVSQNPSRTEGKKILEITKCSAPSL